MRSVSVRRALRLGVCGAAVAGVAVAGLGAAPAVADEPQSDQLWIQAPYERVVTVAPEGGAAQYRDLPVGLYHDNSTFAVTDGRITVDASGLAGVAEVAWPDTCAPSGSTAVCSVPEVPTTGPGYRPQVGLKVRALPGVGTGAQGRITYEARATGGPDGELDAPQGSFDTTVRVGSGPDLRLTDPDPLTGVRPGDTPTMPLTVTNTGNEPARGFSVRMWATYGLDFATTYPQCAYTTPDHGTESAPMKRADCTFDTVVAPGATVELPEPLKAAVAGHALYERLDVSVEPGGGAADLSTDDNHVAWRLDAANTADFAVRGSQVEGAAGDTVTAAFRFVNRGPAWVGHVSSGDPVAVVDFSVPEGTTATTVPDTCEPRSPAGGPVEERLGAPRYACYLPMWAAPDARVTFSFGLRVDRVVPDASGRVVARPDYGTSFPFDPRPRNNTAEVLVNPVG